MNVERINELRNKLADKATTEIYYLSMIKNLQTKFEVESKAKNKHEVLNLTALITKILNDKDTDSSVKLLLQQELSIPIQYFTELKAALGWGTFINPDGLVIEEQAGNAELVQELLYLIETDLELAPLDYSDISQEFLDNRNVKAKEKLALAQTEDVDYKKVLESLSI